MKHIKHALLLLIILISSCTSSSTMKEDNSTIGEFGPKKSVVDAINIEELNHHLSFIASDELNGRAVGTPELKVAAKYIETQLKLYGFKGAAENGSYMQKFDLYQANYLHNTLKINYGGTDIDLSYGKDYAVYGYGGTESYSLTAALVSVGLGLNDDSMTSYDPKSVDGNVALRFAVDGELWEKHKNTREFHQNLRNILYSHGAKSVIIVVEDPERKEAMFKRYMDIAKSSGNSVSTSKESNPRLYVLLAKTAYDKIAKLDNRTLNDKSAFKFKKNITLSLDADAKDAYTQNVVAVFEGTGPVLKSEYIGYGAHYDAVGYNNKDGKIWNGANDDGSGTVGLLSVAKSIAMDPPKRSTIVVFHTGEERGLWGSEYFVNNPLIPLEKMVAMVNMDMIGSNHKPTDIYVVGADRISQELHDINEMMNRSLDNINLDYEWNERFHPERIYYRSDHYNYAKMGIPVIFFSDSDPENYHKESDDVENINFDKLRRVTRLAFSTGYYVANKPERIKITTPVEAPKYTKAYADKYIGSYTAKNGASVELNYENETMILYYFGRSTDLIKVDDETFNGRGYKVSFDFNNSNEAQFMNINFGRQAFDFAKKGFSFPEIKTISLTAAQLKQVSGEYKATEGFMVLFTVENSALNVTMQGQTFPLQAISERKFYLKERDVYFDFKEDSAKPMEVSVSEGGQVQGRAIKVK